MSTTRKDFQSQTGLDDTVQAVGSRRTPSNEDLIDYDIDSENDGADGADQQQSSAGQQEPNQLQDQQQLQQQHQQQQTAAAATAATAAVSSSSRLDTITLRCLLTFYAVSAVRAQPGGDPRALGEPAARGNRARRGNQG